MIFWEEDNVMGHQHLLAGQHRDVGEIGKKSLYEKTGLETPETPVRKRSFLVENFRKLGGFGIITRILLHIERHAQSYGVLSCFSSTTPAGERLSPTDSTNNRNIPGAVRLWGKLDKSGLQCAASLAYSAPETPPARRPACRRPRRPS